MTSSTGKQIITIHILPKISICKGNQTMKYGQLIEYSMRKFPLEELYSKCGGGTSPRPFSKRPKLSISLDQQYENLCTFFYLFIFIVCPSQGLPKYIQAKVLTTFFSSFKAFFFLNKFGSSLLASFFA